LRGRLIAGQQQKAQRGELALALPAGLQRLEDGRVVKDPDRALQHALTLVFQTFLARQSASQVVRVFREQGLRLSRHHRNCVMVWRTPTVAAVIAILRNPAYAGAFVYGKTRTQPQPGRARPRQRRLTPLGRRPPRDPQGADPHDWDRRPPPRRAHGGEAASGSARRPGALSAAQTSPDRRGWRADRAVQWPSTMEKVELGEPLRYIRARLRKE
jgi:Recombinase